MSRSSSNTLYKRNLSLFIGDCCFLEKIFLFLVYSTRMINWSSIGSGVIWETPIDTQLNLELIVQNICKHRPFFSFNTLYEQNFSLLLGDGCFWRNFSFLIVHSTKMINWSSMGSWMIWETTIDTQLENLLLIIFANILSLFDSFVLVLWHILFDNFILNQS